MVIFAVTEVLAAAEEDPLDEGAGGIEDVERAALVVDDPPAAGVDAPCPVDPLPQDARRMTLQVAATAPAASRKVMRVHPIGLKMTGRRFGL
jgi:hypothetical protein